MIAYRGLTKAEFNEVKQEVKKVVSGLSFAYYGNNGIRISPTKRRNYELTLIDAEKVLEVLQRLGMFTLPHEREMEIARGATHGKVSCQLFSMVHKLA